MDEYIPVCYANVTTLNYIYIYMYIYIYICIEFQTVNSWEYFMKFHADDPLHVKSKIIQNK